jgi:misacylated tRNA(Ala) deacylase
VALDRTAFFPGGGGQPPDHGTLAGSPVSRIERDGERLWHCLQTESLPAVGAEVEGELDWRRRYSLMRTHSALHVLSGVVWRDWQAQVTGGSMEPGAGRLDFEFESLTRDLVEEIEARCNAEVEAAREIRVGFLPRAEADQVPDLIRTKIALLPAGITVVRTIEIVGLDLMADGGTHVANTSEIGTIRIPRYKSKGAINKRIYLALGDSAT